MPETESETRAGAFRFCESKGEPFIRGEVESGRSVHISPPYLPYAREWLNIKSQRRSAWALRLSAASAVAAGIAALAALATAIITYLHGH
ncbi:MAG TPA: hypothetical protein VJP80_01055 [Candidatus Saccharimonadales bacterium]|nr:hypothetical protein [Candidatus Saccharimonadales bacterium]